jgi:hypothetical protein
MCLRRELGRQLGPHRQVSQRRQRPHPTPLSVPPEPLFVPSAPQRAVALPVAGVVEPRTLTPPRMRPKRYLPQESKQIGPDHPTPTRGLDRIFLREARFGPDLSLVWGVRGRDEQLHQPSSLPSRCPSHACRGGRHQVSRRRWHGNSVEACRLPTRKAE